MPVQRAIVLNETGEVSPMELIWPGDYRCINVIDENGPSVVAIACHPSDNYGELFVIDGITKDEFTKQHGDAVDEVFTDDTRVTTFGQWGQWVLEGEGEEPPPRICEHPLVGEDVVGTLFASHVSFSPN